jgi:hypothetical protein
MNGTPKMLNFLTGLLLTATHAAEGVEAHATGNQSGTNFAYAIFNDEPAGSSLYLTAFHLTVNGPFGAVSAPHGWAFRTDSFTYVDWFATDSTVPSTNDIPPGGSLTGFALQSQTMASEPLKFSLVSWDRSTNACGSSYHDMLVAPSVTNFAATLTSPVTLGNAGFALSVVGIPSFSYGIEFSPNLNSWTSVVTNTSPFSLVDTNALKTLRGFYRALFVPDTASEAILPD